MGFRFRKSFGPRGLKVNLSKNGISSVSIGRAPFTVNVPVNRRGGVRTTASVPGSGMSWSTEASQNGPKTGVAPSVGSKTDTAGLKGLLSAVGIAAVLGISLIGGVTAIDGAKLPARYQEQLDYCNIATPDTAVSVIAVCSEVRPEDRSKITNPLWLAHQKEEAARADAANAALLAKQIADTQANETRAAAANTSQEQMNADGYFQGPEGGCFTYSNSGRKRYVDRSICAGY